MVSWYYQYTTIPVVSLDFSCTGGNDFLLFFLMTISNCGIVLVSEFKMASKMAHLVRFSIANRVLLFIMFSELWNKPLNSRQVLSSIGRISKDFELRTYEFLMIFNCVECCRGRWMLKLNPDLALDLEEWMKRRKKLDGWNATDCSCEIGS